MNLRHIPITFLIIGIVGTIWAVYATFYVSMEEGMKDKIELEANYDKDKTYYHVTINGFSKFTTTDRHEADSVYELVCKYGRNYNKKIIKSCEK